MDLVKIFFGYSGLLGKLSKWGLHPCQLQDSGRSSERKCMKKFQSNIS